MHIPYHYIPTLRTYSQLCPFDGKAEQVNPRRNRFTGARIFGGDHFPFTDDSCRRTSSAYLARCC